MGKWTALAIEAEESPKRPSHQLTELTEVGKTAELGVLSVSSVGHPGKSGNFRSTGDAELDTLLHRVADYYECPPDERRLMIEAARNNPEDALRSFRLTAQNVALWIRTGGRQWMQ